MAVANIAFCNLRAEMARKRISIADIAKVIGVNRDTAGKKLARKAPIQLDEAFVIRNNFFPECEVNYLFAEAAPTENRPA